MVREYILHDRGNSIFLGDSFGNLPSPVGESATIKKLFKFDEDAVQDKRRKNESKNQAIRIEGKKEKDDEKKSAKQSPDRVPQKSLKIDLDEIEKIVFEETAKAKAAMLKAEQRKAAALAAKQADKAVNMSRGSIYEEEESYENPVNISKAAFAQEDYIDIRSEYANAGGAVNMSIGYGINTSQDEAIVQISKLHLEENAQDSYQIIQTSLNHGKKGGRQAPTGKILDPKQLGGLSP